MDGKNSSQEIAKLNPSQSVIVPLDKVFKNAFNPMKDMKTRRVIEDKRHKDKITTKVEFKFYAGPLDQFDKIVFCAAVSEQRAGNNFFTIRRLWQKMGGSHTLTDAMKEMILESIEKLRHTDVKINMTDISQKYHYTDKAEVIFKNYVLPCKSIEARINGQVVDGAFQILDKSPLMEVAELKKQFAEQPIELLDVPKLKNTDLTMKLKFFLLERITAIIGSHKKHKSHIVGKKQGGGFIYKRATKLRRIITFEDIFEQCGLSDANRWQKQDARNTIKKILEHFVTKKWIKEWHFEKKNGAFYSIHFA